MARFPVIYAEEVVQALDKTRIDASASYVAGTASAITVWEARVNANATWVAISTTDNHFLDWGLPFEFEVISGRNKIDWTGSDGGAYAATLTADQYAPDDLAAHVETQMNLVGPQEFSVAWDEATRKFTITADAGDFTLLPEEGVNAENSILPHMGFDEDEDSAASELEGDEVESVIATAAVRITNADAGNTDTAEMEIRVMHEDSDRLFSSDSKLRQHRSDILRYLSEGRATFKNQHRRAQTLMLDWLAKEGYADTMGHRLTKRALVVTEDVESWATFLCLRLILEDASNAKDDVFADQAKNYKGMEVAARDRAVLQIDLDGDGTALPGEALSPRTCYVRRR
jgi:hypothetical protein